MKKFTALILALCILISSSFIAPKSHAIGGLIFKSRIVRVIGGISMGGGAGIVTAGWVLGTIEGGFGGAILAMIGTYFGLITAGVGLLVLDDKQTVADIAFVPVTAETAPEFSEYAIEVYNSELEELNAIRKTIQAETTDATKLQHANDLWNSYKTMLSSETVEIAESQARKFIEELRNSNPQRI